MPELLGSKSGPRDTLFAPPSAQKIAQMQADKEAKIATAKVVPTYDKMTVMQNMAADKAKADVKQGTAPSTPTGDQTAILEMKRKAALAKKMAGKKNRKGTKAYDKIVGTGLTKQQISV